MYKVYRKYKKNGFRNTLKMTKMCSLRGTVRTGSTPFHPSTPALASVYKSIYLLLHPRRLDAQPNICKPIQIFNPKCLHICLHGILGAGIERCASANW